MTYIIAEPCIEAKDASCVEVCPVDCIYEGEDQFYIHPDECIDCGACEPECPVDAILSEDEVPDDQIPFIELNAELCLEWPNITEQKEPLEDEAKWREVKNKIKYLEK